MVIEFLRRMKHRTLVLRKRLSEEGRQRHRLRRAGVDLDDTVYIAREAVVETGVTIGSHSWVNKGAIVESDAVIGKNVGVAPEAYLCCATHVIGPEHRRAGTPQRLPVIVEDGCWLGARSVVLPGVTVAKGCVIAAGALVTKDTEPNGLYIGSPARRVRDLP